MKLESLRVENYRTLENIDLTFPGLYTAISGQNNAGKTSLIKVLRQTFNSRAQDGYYFGPQEEIDYQADKTQWSTGSPNIIFDYCVKVDRLADAGLRQFVEKFLEKSFPEESFKLRTKLSISAKGVQVCNCFVNDEPLDEYTSKEILQKLKSSNLAFVYDSAARDHIFYYTRNNFLHELIFSPDEREQLKEEQKKLQNKVKNISKAHKTELSELLGHLEDKYEVEFAIPEGLFTRSLPYSINLKDKNVDVPLDDWGSGTKNRTHIMMSLLQAHRIQSKDDQNKITPFVMIEEPESFLHPSAQAEFGRVLRTLANDLKIQTIVTTHSPYMLCQQNISSNILLARKASRGKLQATERIEVQESNWMEPFSQILGLDNSEFSAWKEVLTSTNNFVILVEGEIDKKYLEHINSLRLHGLHFHQHVEILPYQGKDALKNAILLKFFVAKFKKVLITFDLDAKKELEGPLSQLGLREGNDYLALGKPDCAGRDCVEGLIPDRIVSNVHATNTDLVMQLGSGDTKARKSAKNSLKAKIFEAFKNDPNITSSDLAGFSQLFKCLASKSPDSIGKPPLAKVSKRSARTAVLEVTP